MEKKTIMEEMEKITEQVENLKKLIADPTITCNKIWLPGQGIVKLWEVEKQNG